MKLKHLYNSNNFFFNISVPHNTHIQFFNSTIHIVNSDGSNAWGKCIIRQNKIFKKYLRNVRWCIILVREKKTKNLRREVKKKKKKIYCPRNSLKKVISNF